MSDRAGEYRADHPNNKPGQPLPWDRIFNFSVAEIEAQGIIDRWESLKDKVDWDDEKLVDDWLNHLEKYSLEIWYGWEPEEVVRQAIKDLNKQAIDTVKKRLKGQLQNLRPFETDSEDLQDLKRRVIEERTNILEHGAFNQDYIGSARGDPRIDYLPLAADPNRKRGLIAVGANPALRELIRIEETESWRSLNCSYEGNSYCGLP